jgi:hypothetical protein
MTWTDTLSDQQQQDVAWARTYARDFRHGADDHARLLLVAQLADLLDQISGDLQLARIAALDDRTPLARLIAAARHAGAAGLWIVRGATHARLIYTHDPGAAAVLDTALWPLLELTPPLGLIVLIRIPQSDGGADGIAFYGPEPES